MNGTHSYSTSETLRKATLHWLGDRDGYISAPILSNYSAQIAGYDMISGLYTYADEAGVAQLTLNSKVQKAALEALGGYSGTVAVYNYQTGQLVCAVTTPTYDPDDVPDIQGDTTGAYEGAYLNRFVQSVYIPGSIYKVVTLAAALETIPDITQQSFTVMVRLPLARIRSLVKPGMARKTFSRPSVIPAIVPLVRLPSRLARRICRSMRKSSV
jgi:peptidoglycan glycosyltransferase